MKDQIKIMMESAMYRLYRASDEYGDGDDYNKIRQLENLVQALDEAYDAAKSLENIA